MDTPPQNPHPLNCLVTGGTGFIGAALCHQLREQGLTVTILTRQRSLLQATAQAGLSYVGRLADLPVTQAFDVVINLAGEPVVGPRWSARRRAVLHASRRDLTQELVAWIAKAQFRPQLLISASAIGYYGVQDDNDLSALDEAAPAQAIFMSELCQQWEQAAQAARSLGVRVAIIRLGVVLGRLKEGKGALPPMVLPLKFGLSGKIGSGRQTVSWVHLDDVLGAIQFLLTRPAQEADGIYNLCAPVPCTQEVFMATAAEVLQARVLVPLATPACVLRVILGEQSSLLLQGQRVVPARLSAVGYQFRWPALASALQDCLRPG